jgi:AcrR family transcriptional regulator
MSPRRPAVLRESGSTQTLREHLIATAATLIAERGSAGMTVRDIARAAGVADGALYNHFADKEELLAHALFRHVGSVMAQIHETPVPGENTVEDNLRDFVRRGLGVLARVLPAFGGFLTQPQVIARLRDLFGEMHDAPALPHLLGDYLRAEQRLGRIAADADPDAAARLVIGACHDLILPRLLLDPQAPPPEVPDAVIDGIVTTVLRGIAPR